MRHRIRGAEGDYAQSCVATCHPLQNIVHGSVAAARDHSVEARANRHTHLGSSVGASASWLSFNLYASSPEYSRRALNILGPVLAPSS